MHSKLFYTSIFQTILIKINFNYCITISQFNSLAMKNRFRISRKSQNVKLACSETFRDVLRLYIIHFKEATTCKG